MYTDEIDYGGYSTEYMMCATPSMRPLALTLICAVIVVAAVIIAAVRGIRR